MSSAQLQPLDVWIDDLLTRVYFQPDDQLAFSSYESEFSSDVTIEVNSKMLDRATYLAGVKAYRATNVGKGISNTTLSVFCTDPEGKGGVVAQVSKFSTTNKASGQEVLQTAVTICKVASVDGARVLKGLTEVLSDD